MKKLLLFLLFAFVTVTMQAQTANGSETQLEGLQLTAHQTVSTSANVTSIGTDGTVGRVAGENITTTLVPANYSPANTTVKAQLKAIDDRLGQIGNTTAGITNRIYFTGDNVTVTAGTFFASNGSGKGTATSGLPTPLVNGDNQKQYFAKDLISIAQPSATTAPPGNYSGQLTVTTSPTPNGTQQRYTIEIYKTNNGGTPIASGINGAPTGSLGVTVVAILDSGLINLVAGAITNISLNGNLASTLSLATGERLRYHVSAQKVGTGGGNVTMSVLYGSDYNSFYDVTVSQKTSTVINDSGVSGLTASDALNTLNTNLGINSTAIAWVDVNGNNATAQIGNSRKAFLTIDAALDALPSTGGKIFIGIGSFNSPVKAKIKNNTSFIGSGKPISDMTITQIGEFVKPTISKPTKLVGGTILKGTFDASLKNNISVSNLGIDCGKDWVDTFNGGVAIDAFVSAQFPLGTLQTASPQTVGLKINNVSALGYSATSAFHCVLVENSQSPEITNVTTYYNIYGLVLKNVGGNVVNFSGYGHGTAGIIIKSDAYVYGQDINVSNAYITSIESYDGNGIVLDSFLGTLQRVNISNSNIEYTKLGIEVAGSKNINEVNISNMNIYKAQTTGIQMPSSVKNSNISNVIIDGSVYGIDLTAASGCKTLSNIIIRNCSSTGYLLNASSSGKMILNGTDSVDNAISYNISGNVYGSNNLKNTTQTGVFKFSSQSIYDDGLSTSVTNASYSKFDVKSNVSGDSGGGVLSFMNQTKTFANISGETESAGNGMLIFRTLTAGSLTEKARFSANGVLNIPNLSGTGMRTVVADASGNLSATDIAPTSGTYTPTLSTTTNLTSATLNTATYIRVGDIITVTISALINVTTTNALATLTATLPISRVSTVALEAGSGVGLQSGYGAQFFPVHSQMNSNTTQVNFFCRPTNSGNHTLTASFSYKVN